MAIDLRAIAEQLSDAFLDVRELSNVVYVNTGPLQFVEIAESGSVTLGRFVPEGIEQVVVTPETWSALDIIRRYVDANADA